MTEMSWPIYGTITSFKLKQLKYLQIMEINYDHNFQNIIKLGNGCQHHVQKLLYSHLSCKHTEVNPLQHNGNNMYHLL
jgi:hypothetical protein